MQQWNDELASIAEAHARRCEFKHDDCRKTRQFPLSGQNLAYDAQSDGYPDASIAVERQINRWFAENKDADMSYINSFHLGR